MNGDWQVHVEYRPGIMSTFIYVSRRRGEVVEFITKGGDEFRTLKNGDVAVEDIYYGRFEDPLVGQLLVEALDKHGVKAPAQSFIAGKLEATEAHLEDVRKLVPALTMPPFEDPILSPMTRDAENER